MKSQMFILVCLMTFFSGFSQLSVKENSLFIVKDEVLFVKDALKLTNANSKIYLRDEAQLVQGNGITGNSGLGAISVYQEGTVNQWSYNYWCSPVGNHNVDNNINSDFLVNLIDDPLLGTPDVTDSNNALFTTGYNGSAPPLTISSRWLYTFEDHNNDQNSWWHHVGQNNSIKPGLGFTMKGTGTAEFGNQTYDFRGKPNNGDLFNKVLDNQFTLVGNPYPSALDTRSFIHDVHNRNTINGTLYFWEQKSTNSHYLADYEGGYATYTISADGVIESFTKALFSKYNGSGQVVELGSASNTSKKVGRYIPIGQGFIVQGVLNSTVKTSNTHRTYYKESLSQSEFFRNDNFNQTSIPDSQLQVGDVIPDEYKNFRVYITFNDTYIRELLINFHDSATTGFDYGLESVSPGGAVNDAYWNVSYGALVTQALPYSIDLEIPIALNLNGDLAVEFNVGDIHNFDESQSIFLYDQELNTYTNLREVPYELTLNPGLFEERFKIVFERNDSTLHLDEVTSESVSVYTNISPSQLVVSNPKLMKLSNLKLYDITGKLMYEKAIQTIDSKYVVSTKHLSSSVYMIVITGEGGTIHSQKLVIVN